MYILFSTTLHRGAKLKGQIRISVSLFFAAILSARYEKEKAFEELLAPQRQQRDKKELKREDHESTTTIRRSCALLNAVNQAKNAVVVALKQAVKHDLCHRYAQRLFLCVFNFFSVYKRRFAAARHLRRGRPGGGAPVSGHHRHQVRFQDANQGTSNNW